MSKATVINEPALTTNKDVDIEITPNPDKFQVCCYFLTYLISIPCFQVKIYGKVMDYDHKYPHDLAMMRAEFIVFETTLSSESEYDNEKSIALPEEISVFLNDEVYKYEQC